MASTIANCAEELDELSTELNQLKENHKIYVSKVDELKNIQLKCQSTLKHQCYRMKLILGQLDKLENVLTGEQLEEVLTMKRDIQQRLMYCAEIGETLPAKNGLYLSIILGQVNVSILSKIDKFAYKKDYEKFKLVVNFISAVMAFMLYFFWSHRVFDALFQFLLVWYYCTLTIREHILIQNGSRIKGWWIAHHFVSTFLCGVVLVWPRGYTYYEFRDQFNLFSLYMSLVQIIQCYYQQGVLYKLRALGERHSMDITVDGFMSWMWKRLTFLIPLLLIAYGFQFYNSYVLFKVYTEPDENGKNDREWQVIALSITFMVLFIGNLLTLAKQLKSKIRDRGIEWSGMVSRRLRKKYKFFSKNRKKSVSITDKSDDSPVKSTVTTEADNNKIE